MKIIKDSSSFPLKNIAMCLVFRTNHSQFIFLFKISSTLKKNKRRSFSFLYFQYNPRVNKLCLHFYYRFYFYNFHIIKKMLKCIYKKEDDHNKGTFSIFYCISCNHHSCRAVKRNNSIHAIGNVCP